MLARYNGRLPLVLLWVFAEKTGVVRFRFPAETGAQKAMFFFPYGTDAPVYYFPFTTIVMIVVNVLVFWGIVASPEAFLPYVLEHGKLNPLQWVTSNFIHGGWMHLIGNMLSLWSFGLIVEGKLGWYKTLAIFLGIGVVQCAVEQVCMLGASEGASFGASAIIYGFMAMSFIWAPANEMLCVFILGFRIFLYEIRVTAMVGTLLAIQIVIVLFTGMALTSAMLHVMGAVLGFGISIWMLRTGRVDCEHWDFFSVWAGRNTISREEWERMEAESPERQQRREENMQKRRAEAMAAFHHAVQSGLPALALKNHQRLSIELPGWGLTEADLLALIKSFHKNKQWVESIPAMIEYLARCPQNSALVRLKLAQILVMECNRPAQALTVMAKIDETALDDAQRTFLRKLRAKAQQRHEEDPYEVVDGDW